MIRVEDSVKIVKRAGSIKRDCKEKISKIVKRAALLIGSWEYVNKLYSTVVSKYDSTQSFSRLMLQKVEAKSILKYGLS